MWQAFFKNVKQCCKLENQWVHDLNIWLFVGHHESWFTAVIKTNVDWNILVNHLDMHWHIRIKHFLAPWCKTQLTPALIHRLSTLNYKYLIWTDCIVSLPLTGWVFHQLPSDPLYIPAVFFFLFFISKRVTFSSPDVTPFWISCLCLLFVTLRSAPLPQTGCNSSQPVVVQCGAAGWREQWKNWGSMREGHLQQSLFPAVGSVHQWTALGSLLPKGPTVEPRLLLTWTGRESSVFQPRIAVFKATLAVS